MRGVQRHIKNHCGTTVVLRPVSPHDTELQIKEIVQKAIDRGYVAGVYVDPTYPVDKDLTVEALTMGYILLFDGESIEESPSINQQLESSFELQP